MYAPQPTFIPAQGKNLSVVEVPTTPQRAEQPAEAPHVFTQTLQQYHQRKLDILEELRQVGMGRVGFMYSEVKMLPQTLHPNEHIRAVVHGRHEGGYAILLATDNRVIFLDKKPMFVKSDELSYDIVGGVNFSRSMLAGSITLHTRIGDYTLKTRNYKAAERFRDYIEERCLERSLDERIQRYENVPRI